MRVIKYGRPKVSNRQSFNVNKDAYYNLRPHMPARHRFTIGAACCQCAYDSHPFSNFSLMLLAISTVLLFSYYSPHVPAYHHLWVSMKVVAVYSMGISTLLMVYSCVLSHLLLILLNLAEMSFTPTVFSGALGYKP